MLNEARRFHCYSCDYVSDDKRILCVHQNYQHRGPLQLYPWREGEAPWDAGDSALIDMYEHNRHVILANVRMM